MNTTTSTTNSARAILEVGVFWVVFAAALVLVGAAPQFLGPGWRELVLGGVLTAVTLGLIALFLRRGDQHLADVGLALAPGSLRRFGIGLLVGAVIVLAMIVLLAGLSGARIEAIRTPDYANAVGLSFVVLLVLAYMEEVAFRSFALVRLREAWGVRAAIYVTAVCFAFYHGPHAANLLGPGVWGLLYGLAAIASRGIALPLGIHFGANWIQSLFSMKTEYTSGLWQVVPGTGAGPFPAEQVGLAMQLVLLLVGVVLIERYVRRGDANALERAG